MMSQLHQHIAELTHALTDSAQNGDHEIMAKINAGSRISPRLALAIYRNNTRAARIRALQQIFPACQRILGDDAFRAIAGGYVRADNNGASDLNRYGGMFNRHLDGLVAAERLPGDYAYLADLASLEYKYHAAYYADADPDFDFDLFASRVKSGHPIRFQISASLGLLASQYPVFEVWQLNRRARSAHTGVPDHADVQAIDGTQCLLVHREHYTPVVVPVSELQYRLLAAFADGRSLQAVIGEVDVDTHLPRMIANKWIVGIRHDE